MAELHPCKGGCWFCKQDGEREVLHYDVEFDTYVHINCILNALTEDNPEAEIMSYLINWKGKLL